MINSDENARFGRICFGDFEIDRGRRQLSKNGQPITLTAKAFDLLLFLVENSGRVVSKDEILNSIWKDQFVEESNLSVQVSTIRKVLGDSASEPSFLATIPGKGYQFVGEISEPVEAPDAPSEAVGLVRSWSPRSLVIVTVIAIAALTAAIFFLGPKLFGTRRTEVRSIAVLPFELKGDDPGYLGDGLAESVIFSLSRLPGIKVLSSGSSFRYRSEKPDAASIGRDLGVEAILTGRISQSGETVSVRAELVSTVDNSVLWGEQLSRKLSDIEELQRDIAQAITVQLQVRLSGADQQKLSNQTDNEEAYRLYLIGLHHMNRLTDDGFAKGRDNFLAAVEKDPNYALAFAALADSYNTLCGWGALPPGDCFPLAKSAALRSLELDSDLAEGYAALGVTKMSYENDWAGAEQDLSRAIELNPNLLHAHQARGQLFMLQSRFDDARSSLDRARELDPLSILNIIMVGNVYYYQRQTTPAIEIFSQAVEMDPNSGLARWSLGNALFLADRPEDAIAEYAKAIQLSGDSPDEMASLAYLHARRGNTAEAQKIMTELTGRQGYVPPALTASVYGALGEKDRAFELLEEAFQKKDSLLIYLGVDPIFDPLRSDARFPVLLKRMGL